MTTHIAVTLDFTDRYGRSTTWREESSGTNAADAICNAFDNIEASGVDLDSLTSIRGSAVPIHQVVFEMRGKWAA